MQRINLITSLLVITLLLGGLTGAQAWEHHPITLIGHAYCADGSPADGVFLTLYKDWVAIANTTTDNGAYQFDPDQSGNVLMTPGNYVVYALSYDPPPYTGHWADAEDPAIIELADLIVPCPPPATGSIGDLVWDDQDKDGLQDPEEPGVYGVTVNLKDSAGNLVASTITSGNGAYLFDGLAAGCYVVEFVLPEGCVFTVKDQGAYDALDSDADPTTGRTVPINLAAGQTDLTWDAGLICPPPPPPTAVGDRVWNDQNRNGLQDVGEPGVPDVYINLFNCDGEPRWIAGARTDAEGYYFFDNLKPGCYFLEFVPPAGCTFSLPDQGNNDTIDSDADPGGRTIRFTLAAEQTDRSWDAGLICETPPPPAEKACPRSPGFWKQQVNQSPAAKFTREEIDALMGQVLAMTTVFDDSNEIKFVLNAPGKKGPLVRAKRQFAAFSLNLAAGDLFGDTRAAFIFHSTLLDPEVWGSLELETVGEAYAVAEYLILTYPDDKCKLEWAYTMSEWINEGYGVMGYCGGDDDHGGYDRDDDHDGRGRGRRR